MRARIVVTGMGAVTPVGCGVGRYWQNLIDGRSGVGPITRFDAGDLAVRIAAQVPAAEMEGRLPRDLILQTDAFTQYACVAAREALGDALVAEPERMGIVMGTAMAGVSTVAATQELLSGAVHRNVGPRFVPRVLGNMAAAQVAIAHDIRGPSVTLSRENENPLRACRPFDADRRGFVIGEGGGALVLETEEHARRRGAEILAELAGWSNNSDAWHVTEPRPDGAGAAACMTLALKKADLSPAEVDYINAHGTGTRAGDAAEAEAIRRVFGPNGPAVSSTKGATGHMMGAGGITEAIACIQALQFGVLPPTLNLEQPQGGLDFVAGVRRVRAIDVAMSNAFGFGGQNSCLVFRRR